MLFSKYTYISEALTHFISLLTLLSNHIKIENLKYLDVSTYIIVCIKHSVSIHALVYIWYTTYVVFDKEKWSWFLACKKYRLTIACALSNLDKEFGAINEVNLCHNHMLILVGLSAGRIYLLFKINNEKIKFYQTSLMI